MNQQIRKNVLVTGSSKGIGKNIAKTLILNGYNVYICARNEKLLTETAKEIKATGYFSIDLAKSSNCELIIEEMIKKAGSIDILINNAGGYVYSPIEKTEEKDIETLIN